MLTLKLIHRDRSTHHCAIGGTFDLRALTLLFFDKLGREGYSGQEREDGI
jgi:hypothetical protein